MKLTDNNDLVFSSPQGFGSCKSKPDYHVLSKLPTAIKKFQKSFIVIHQIELSLGLSLLEKLSIRTDCKGIEHKSTLVPMFCPCLPEPLAISGSWHSSIILMVTFPSLSGTIISSLWDCISLNRDLVEFLEELLTVNRFVVWFSPYYSAII